MLHLLPILSPYFVEPTAGEVMKKIYLTSISFSPSVSMLPPSQNARQKIYADISQFLGEDGAGLFNVLAFCGVFFGSPFAQSDWYRWFNTFGDWEKFRAEGLEVAKRCGKNGEEEKYYVKRNCYGQSQTDLSMNYFQYIGTNASYGAQLSTNWQSQRLQRSINGFKHPIVTSGLSLFVEISLKQAYCQCLLLMNGVG